MKDNEISHENNFSFKKAQIKVFKYGNIDNQFNFRHSSIFFFIILLFIIIIQFIIICNLKSSINNIFASKKSVDNQLYDINFKYEDYDKDMITDKIKKDSGWILSLNEAQFINGIIRKNKLKNCLEIGVAQGGSSVLILNAIKDIKDSILVSLDLNKELYNDPKQLTGYRVNQYFPELSKNWKLYTGEQPHKFLVNLNIKFDFLFLDSAHVSPGEIINFIEALPFLNKNAIVVIHDLFWHFRRVIDYKFFPSCISLIPILYGDKVFLHSRDRDVSNIGAVFLHPNQEQHYLDYFLLLLNFWEYIPKDFQINELRIFIKKYYKGVYYILKFNDFF